MFIAHAVAVSIACSILIKISKVKVFPVVGKAVVVGIEGRVFGLFIGVPSGLCFEEVGNFIAVVIGEEAGMGFFVCDEKAVEALWGCGLQI